MQRPNLQWADKCVHDALAGHYFFMNKEMSGEKRLLGCIEGARSGRKWWWWSWREEEEAVGIREGMQEDFLVVGLEARVGCFWLLGLHLHLNPGLNHPPPGYWPASLGRSNVGGESE